jgi:hypothetical protein
VIDLSTYGRPLNLLVPVVARVTREPVTEEAERTFLALVTETSPKNWGMFPVIGQSLRQKHWTPLRRLLAALQFLSSTRRAKFPI